MDISNAGTQLAIELLADFDEKTIETIIRNAEKEVKKDQAKEKSNATI